MEFKANTNQSMYEIMQEVRQGAVLDYPHFSYEEGSKGLYLNLGAQRLDELDDSRPEIILSYKDGKLSVNQTTRGAFLEREENLVTEVNDVRLPATSDKPRYHPIQESYPIALYLKEDDNRLRVRVVWQETLLMEKRVHGNKPAEVTSNYLYHYWTDYMSPEKKKELFLMNRTTKGDLIVYKDTGNIVLKNRKGSQTVVRWGNFEQRTGIGFNIRALLRVVPDWFMKKMIAALKESSLQRAAIEKGYALEIARTHADMKKRLSLESQFMDWAAYTKEPVRHYLGIKSDGRQHNYLNLTDTARKRLSTMDSGVGFLQYLYPNLGKKAARRWITERKLGYSRTGEAASFLLAVMPTGDISQILEDADYTIPFSNKLDEIPHSTLKRVIAKLVGMDKFVRLVHNSLVNGRLNMQRVRMDTYGPPVDSEFADYVLDLLWTLEQAEARRKEQNIQWDASHTGFFLGAESLRELHDGASRLLSVMDDASILVPFSYKEDVRALELKKENYSFELANSKMELREVGNSMNICVGSYGDWVARGETIIVLVREEGKQDVEVCIELDGKAKEVRQVKKKYNRYIQKEEAVFALVKKWVETNRLTLNTVDFSLDGSLPKQSEQAVQGVFDNNDLPF